jgi:hypothetical protein
VRATSVKLLQAAAAIVGGYDALAARLGIGEKLLQKLATDTAELPDVLVLRTVDIILAERACPESSRRVPAIQKLQNCGRGFDATSCGTPVGARAGTEYD